MQCCSKCQSNKLVPEALVLDAGENNVNYGFRVAIDENPQAWVFKERFASGVKAKVCGECGFIEFYATHPLDFYQAFLRSKEPR